jgi:tetratricopeptide (TPR) repeat protein
MGLVLGVPVLLLVAVEGGLRLLGYGYPTAFCLRWGKEYVDNARFVCQFYSRTTYKTNLRPTPFALPIEKPAGEVRIVVLGESAAAGAPDPAYSFGRILERMLCHQFPHQPIEVISAAMRGVNSHIILPAARDCLCLKPDLFIVYMGNNEAVGLHAPGPHSGRFTPYPRILRGVQRLRSTRLGELMEPVLRNFNREGTASTNQDSAFFQQHRIAADDRRRAAVYENFRLNLQDICRLARRAGAGVVLSTVAGNLKDCPPFGSLHRDQLSDAEKDRWDSAYSAGISAEAARQFEAAVSHYSAAAALDDHFADLHFCLGRCHYEMGAFDKAREEYIQARDWDALQFRADSRLNESIRQQVDHPVRPGLLLVDAERVFNDSELSEHRIPGQRLFYDHVHPTFDGAYLLARTMLPPVIQALTNKIGQLPASPAPLLSREECAQTLAFTRVNEAQISAAVIRLTALPPFTSQLEHDERQAAAKQRLKQRFGDMSQHDFDLATATSQAAIRQTPDDWELPYNFARTLLLPAHDYARAIVQFEAARRLLPHAVAIRLELSNALNAAGRKDEALAELSQALALEPRAGEIREAIAAVRSQRPNTATP